MEIERKFLIKKKICRKTWLLIPAIESSRVISAPHRWSASEDRTMTIFSLINPKD